jgi:hypothetical protein
MMIEGISDRTFLFWLDDMSGQSHQTSPIVIPEILYRESMLTENKTMDPRLQISGMTDMKNSHAIALDDMSRVMMRVTCQVI